MEPAPNKSPGPGKPKTDDSIPTTPFLQRVAPFSSDMPLFPPPSASTNPLPFRGPLTASWETPPQSDGPSQLPRLPPPTSIFYRRGRQLQSYRSHPVPGPTLASIGVDREDTPPHLRSINSVLNAPDTSGQRTARPLLPTPNSSLWPPGRSLNSLSEALWASIGHDAKASTPCSASSGSPMSISPFTPHVRSPLGRRNALADIRSPCTPAMTDAKDEATTTSQGPDQTETRPTEDGSNDLVALPSQIPTRDPTAEGNHRPSRFVEHLDVSAPESYFDQQGQLNSKHDSGCEGDDEKSA